MSGQRHFTPQWEEHVQLNGETDVYLRLGRVSDRVLLRRGFDDLSSASKFMRFLSDKPSLSRAELDYLTDLDDMNHLAIGAFTLDPVGRENGIAVARFIRSSTTHTEAEPAIAVVDAFQGCGLGMILAARLARAARERKVNTFRFDILSTNARMKHLVDDVARFANVTLRPAEGVVEVRVDLSELDSSGVDASPSPVSDAVRTILRHAAGHVSSLALKQVRDKSGPEQN